MRPTGRVFCSASRAKNRNSSRYRRLNTPVSSSRYSSSLSRPRLPDVPASSRAAALSPSGGCFRLGLYHCGVFKQQAEHRQRCADVLR